MSYVVDYNHVSVQDVIFVYCSGLFITIKKELQIVMCSDSKEFIWPVCYNFYLLFHFRTAYGVIIHLINETDATFLSTW